MSQTRILLTQDDPSAAGWTHGLPAVGETLDREVSLERARWQRRMLTAWLADNDLVRSVIRRPVSVTAWGTRAFVSAKRWGPALHFNGANSGRIDAVLRKTDIVPDEKWPISIALAVDMSNCNSGDFTYGGLGGSGVGGVDQTAMIGVMTPGNGTKYRLYIKHAATKGGAPTQSNQDSADNPNFGPNILVAVIERDRQRLWENGRPLISTTVALGGYCAFSQTFPKTVLGNLTASSSDNTGLKVHGMYVWNRALTSSEVMALTDDFYAPIRPRAGRFTVPTITTPAYDYWYPLSTTTADGWLELQVAGSAPPASTLTTGWRVDGLAANQYARMEAGVIRSANVFSGTAQPSSGPDSTLKDCWRTAKRITVNIPAGTWTIPIPVIASVAAREGAQAAVMVRLWRSANADGSSATEITSGAVQGSTITALQSEAEQVSTATVSLGALSWSGQYLFLQVALRVA